MKKKIALVVDDNQGHRYSIMTFLQIRRFDVETASDGLQALQMMGAKKYDLVFSDIEMPNMNGLELLHQIRQKNNQVPVIMISSLGSLDSIRTAIAEGANSYITKPFSVEGMNNALTKVGF